ncbi:MAG: hypothetical protein QM756_15970 [Polyangiaceae bacterium]
MVATVEGKTRELKLGADHTYAQSFEYDDPGVTYVIGLLRGTLGDAPFSTAIPPALFELDAVAATISRGAALELSWAPAGEGNVHYSVTGTCLKGLEADAPDSGSLSIAAAALQASGSGGTCDATLTVSRANEGHLDAVFSVGGVVEARQLRSVTFSSTP